MNKSHGNRLALFKCDIFVIFKITNQFPDIPIIDIFDLSCEYSTISNGLKLIYSNGLKLIFQIILAK